MMRVLVADDEAPARGKLQRWLSEQADIEVVAESEDGLRAAEAIERLKPDVVFLDIQMPRLNGLQFLQSLDHPPLVIIVTAYEQYAVEGFNLQVADYIVKPYSFDRFLKACNRAAELFRLKQMCKS